MRGFSRPFSRTTLSTAAVLMVAAGLAAGQKDTSASRAPKKGEAIVVKGCLTGQALEATELGWVDATGALSSGVTFRLTGDRNILKQLRDEHDGRVVRVEGVLKSDLPKDSVATRSVGKVRITIGTPAASPGSQAAETRRALPVLEVKSCDGTSVTCGR